MENTGSVKKSLSRLVVSQRLVRLYLLVVAAAIAAPGVAFAQRSITGVEVEPSQVTTNQAASISVLGIGPCRFELDFGDGDSMTTNNNFNQNGYQTNHSWATAGEKTVTAVALGLCTGSAERRVMVSNPASPASPASPGINKKAASSAIQIKPGAAQIKAAQVQKFVPPPQIEAALVAPLGPLSPGARLFLKGKGFGTQPGKILVEGDFPEGPIELVDVAWESDSRINGLVPASAQGRKNQSVDIKVLAAPPPEDNVSNAWKMSFIGSPYCGKADRANVILDFDGTVARRCGTYRCIEDKLGPHCLTQCSSTADCAPGYVCRADERCGK